MITQQQIQEFKQQGYDDTEIQEAIDQTAQEEQALTASYQQAQEYDRRRIASNTLISGDMNQDNLIKWQLELDSILERVEHMLRGDRPETMNHRTIWIKAKDIKEVIFNNSGVAEIMRILSLYLNRNTILSNYDDETINWKVLDFGKEVSDLIFLKYESFGLNTLEKRKLYPMIVKQLVDTVHSAYLRAYHGGERESLREARSIQQTEQFSNGAPININTGSPMRERGLLNPLRWFGSKYKA